MFIRSIINFRGPALHTEKLLHSEHGFNCIVQEATQFGEHFACFIKETGYPGQHEYMKISRIPSCSRTPAILQLWKMEDDKLSGCSYTS